jgi:DNA-directed RNA polymerase omega subunit
MMNNMTKQEEIEYAATLGLTSEAAVAALGNRYDLILIASRRCRELSRGDQPRVPTRHGHVLTTLKEIEFGKVGRDYLLKPTEVAPRRRKWDSR